MEKYNGWKNKDSWNCALWINNDAEIYRIAMDFFEVHNTPSKACEAFVGLMDGELTGDGVEFTFKNCIEYFTNEYNEYNLVQYGEN